MKQKLCRKVHSISFYKNIVFIAVAYALRLLWHLKVSIDFDGENENWHYCCFIADILTKVFLEMFVEWSSTKHILFVQPLNLIGCHGKQKGQFAKNIKKSTPQKVYGGRS